MRSVLFVDDEPLVLRGIELALRSERRRWNMAFACGATTALRALEAEPFDVLVTDLDMPEMDGIELLGRVRKAFPKTQGIILSGKADRGVVERARFLVKEFLRKPCRPDDLRACVERNLPNDLDVA